MSVQDIARVIVLPVLALAIILTFVRLVRGPSLPDRVIAFDLFAALGIGLMATYSIASGEAIYLDIAVVLALLSFLGTVAFAFYLEKRIRQ